jgi:predicted acetyltransferase
VAQPVIEVSVATAADRTAAENLMQLYQYDFTEFDDNDVSKDGRFVEIDLDRFFGSDDRFVYFLRVDGQLAGVALVSDTWSVLDEADHFMAEFFVMRKYRRRGCGARFATELFERHRGVWEVAQMRSNVPAQGFWRKTIAAFTAGEYTEHDVDDDRWDGPVQVFTS